MTIAFGQYSGSARSNRWLTGGGTDCWHPARQVDQLADNGVPTG
jgi:hypothetical protein